MSVSRLLGVAVVALLAASPAYAQAVPDAPVLVDVALLGAGVAGLLFGRRSSRSRGPRE